MTTVINVSVSRSPFATKHPNISTSTRKQTIEFLNKFHPYTPKATYIVHADTQKKI